MGPIPNPNPNLGAVNIDWGAVVVAMAYSVGLPWSAVAVAAGVAVLPPAACHGTPQRRAMRPYATPWDAVGMPWVCHGCYHGHATQNSNSVVEPWIFGASVPYTAVR